MTAVENYRTTHLDFPSDVPTNGRSAHSPAKIITKKHVPPAVPSPPPYSDRSPPRNTVSSQDREAQITMSSKDGGQWLFTEAELASAPSVLDGLPAAEERCRRAKGVNFIVQAGILLKLPQLTLATASVFFHRFYMRRSMVPEKDGLHHYNIAATALFLATKTEENCRKTKEIVIAVAKVAQKNASLIIDEQSKEYWRWRDSILLYEELMLEVLTFDVVLHSPYNSLYHFLQKLQIEDNKALRNAAWAFLNDSSLTTMCLLVPPKDIAVAAIYFSARYTHTQIPDDESGNAWWEQLGGKAEMITKAVTVINEFYSENPLKRSENPYGQSPASAANEEELERTRSSNETFRGDTPASQDRTQSQRTPNEHRENGNGTPAVNGNASSHETNGVASAEVSAAVVNGSTDEPLKEAANDSATHESNANGNDISNLGRSADETSKLTPKRGLEDGEGPVSKKAKIDSEADHPEAPKPTSPAAIAAVAESPKVDAAKQAEESEEGELEE